MRQIVMNISKADAWESEVGSFADSTLWTTIWTAPDSVGTFTLSVAVSDGKSSSSGSVDVETGNTSLTVETDFPGAFITLNGSLQPDRTPHTFDPLPPGLHQVRVDHPEFRFAVAGMLEGRKPGA